MKNDIRVVQAPQSGQNKAVIAGRGTREMVANIPHSDVQTQPLVMSVSDKAGVQAFTDAEHFRGAYGQAALLGPCDGHKH
ncbi:hypothetical protein J2Z31_003671 [Sinorhizobium kostiense]|uniref:Uncharacterized protein n=1 Tax=Sinorhizobium kostiense TaxID=76747 RepID=A0ABS4R2R0_9HYPH|nr:hypothetical protein [Sinorhizobium kostiense]MBP2237157.1 hypothetical protein [Sinorhizobium kostiense]